MSSIPQENKISTISVPIGYSLGLKKDKKSKVSFHMVGNGRKSKESNLKTIDLFKEAETMTKAELIALNKIKDNMVWGTRELSEDKYTNGLSYIPASIFDTASDRRVFQKGMHILKTKELAIKVDKNTYMLHPLAIIPTDIEEGMRIWNECWENQ